MKNLKLFISSLPQVVFTRMTGTGSALVAYFNSKKAAKNAGVLHFVYASSCSVYGSADDKPRTENSELNPLTAYAKSKVWTEKELEP